MAVVLTVENLTSNIEHPKSIHLRYNFIKIEIEVTMSN